MANAAETVSRFCRLKASTKPDLPVRASEMGLLILLFTSEAPITPAMAADFFGVKKPMVTSMANALKGKGYLERIPSDVDGRSVILRLTPQGQALVASTMDAYLASLDLLRARMGDADFQSLIELMERANRILMEER